MTPIQSLTRNLRTGADSLVIELPSEPGTRSLRASFLTVALNIVAETDRAIAVMVGGNLQHCALLSPHNQLVLDATGVRPVSEFKRAWQVRTGEVADIRIVSIADLEVICPPESVFFARALSSFEKVVIQHFAASTDVPALLGYQVQNAMDGNWADRPSFEILPQDLAALHLHAARKAEPKAGWVMIAIFEGDIEEPTFA